MKKIPTLVPVVAAALLDSNDRVLMHQRAIGGHHGGRWEFPGGKVELNEAPEDAIVREIQEELSVSLERSSLRPANFASDPSLPAVARAPHVVMLYVCRSWSGEPYAVEGEAVAWLDLAGASKLDLAPLDRILLAGLERFI